MTKFTEEISGYLEINEDSFAYFLSKNWVELQPAVRDKRERLRNFERLKSLSANAKQTYIYGTCGLDKIAFLCNSGIQVGLSLNSNIGLSYSAGFSPPLIIRSNCRQDDVKDWTSFDAIKFSGGNINALHPPMQAIKNLLQRKKQAGNQDILFYDSSEYGFKSEINITGEGGTFEVSVETDMETSPSTRNYDACTLGNINSYIRIEFQTPKKFDEVEEIYLIVKDLISLLTGASNVAFNVFLEQKADDRFVESARCYIADDYENYSIKKWDKVIPLREISSFLPQLFKNIQGKEAENICLILPDDNKKLNYVSMHQIQDLCTMLEESYKWMRGKRKVEKDEYIKGLIKIINQTIENYDSEYNGIKADKITNILSCFKYLDFTLSDKIITLYKENVCLINQIYNRFVVTDKIDLTSDNPIITDLIKKFVKLRNNRTHSGAFIWDGSECLFDPLLALVYACFFMHSGADQDLSYQLVKRLF